MAACKGKPLAKHVCNSLVNNGRKGPTPHVVAKVHILL